MQQVGGGREPHRAPAAQQTRIQHGQLHNISLSGDGRGKIGAGSGGAADDLGSSVAAAALREQADQMQKQEEETESLRHQIANMKNNMADTCRKLKETEKLLELQDHLNSLLLQQERTAKEELLR